MYNMFGFVISYVVHKGSVFRGSQGHFPIRYPAMVLKFVFAAFRAIAAYRLLSWMVMLRFGCRRNKSPPFGTVWVNLVEDFNVFQ